MLFQGRAPERHYEFRSPPSWNLLFKYKDRIMMRGIPSLKWEQTSESKCREFRQNSQSHPTKGPAVPPSRCSPPTGSPIILECFSAKRMHMLASVLEPVLCVFIKTNLLTGVHALLETRDLKLRVKFIDDGRRSARFWSNFSFGLITLCCGLGVWTVDNFFGVSGFLKSRSDNGTKNDFYYGLAGILTH